MISDSLDPGIIEQMKLVEIESLAKFGMEEEEYK